MPSGLSATAQTPLAWRNGGNSGRPVAVSTSRQVWFSLPIRILDPSAVDALLPLLTDPSDDVREETVEALGRIGSPRAVPALEQVAARDGDEDVRGKAQFALRRIASAGR